MKCTKWNDDWIAWLYDELEPDEASTVEDHLASCGSCRETMTELEQSRDLLRGAAPDVPFAPRLVFVGARRTRTRPALAFAGGLLAAAAVFALGLVTAPLLRPATAAEGALEARLERLEQQQAEAAPAEMLPASRQDAPLTRREFDDEMYAMRQQFEEARSHDLDFILGEITAAEWRTGRHLKDQGNVLLNTMLASSPGFREH